jgi:hypothetical protein
MASTRAEASCGGRGYREAAYVVSVRRTPNWEERSSPIAQNPRTNFGGDGAGAGGVGESWRKNGSKTSPMIRPKIALNNSGT